MISAVAAAIMAPFIPMGEKPEVTKDEGSNQK